MSEFPHSALNPSEATPRITPAHAEEVIRLIDETGDFPTSPAIVIAVWTGGLVKYLIDDVQATDTIRNLRKAAAREKEPSDKSKRLARRRKRFPGELYPDGTVIDPESYGVER